MAGNYTQTWRDWDVQLRYSYAMHTLSALRAGDLAGITRLDLSCELTEFPSEIFKLADTLEILNLSGNALSSLPDDLYRLHKLRVIFCSDNLFTELPSVLGQCAELEMVGFKANKIKRVHAMALPKKLRWLILTDNQIGELPNELGSCTQLQKLMLSGNQLRHLPDLSHCVQLELLLHCSESFYAVTRLDIFIATLGMAGLCG
jgi:Leucine-rich repeat (LRR) protein